MFAVLFEVHPKQGQTDTYLGYAKMLRPEVEKIDGFIDNVRYRSLTRDGWLLAMSGWRDEKAMVRWRVHARHHAVQDKGRTDVFSDYHLRIGEITDDTRPPQGHSVQEQRLDETQVGDATTVTLIDVARPPEWVKATNAPEIATALGLELGAEGLVAWDVFEAVLTPGDVILLLSWRTKEHADAFEKRVALPEGARRRRVRIVRDYGQFDRREAPQYYPDVAREKPMTDNTKQTVTEPMYCYLYSLEDQRRVSDVFADEDKLWVYAKTHGYCGEEIDREDADPRCVLNPGIEIHESTANGERVGMNARTERV
ncbi:antibiotic biosynthesis monooxygenase family protein [Bradyrhizobium sp. SYSU BS000235]|uniref:antibiotic biosynthesis monooxygenase family protein n=1 Tax=Bradyrhizobium sp. SYSU BS000235 TaxID=3411332 RepID=UPI003C782CFE